MIGMFTRFRALGPAALLYLSASALVGFAVDGGVYSVIFNLYLIRLGYGPEMIGIIVGVAQFIFALSSVPAGMLGSRYGSRQMLALGIALMFVGGIVLPLADILPESLRLFWLFGGEIVFYFGIALYFVNTAPFLISLVAPRQRTMIFGLQSALLAVAAFLGGVIGGFLPGWFGNLIGETLQSPAPYRYPLLIAGLAMLPALFAILATRNIEARPEVAAEQEIAGAATHLVIPSVILTVIVMMGVVRMLQVSGLAATTSFFNVYLDQALAVPTAQIGTIAAFGRLLAAPGALATPLLTRRFGNFHTVTLATLATALVILPMAFIQHWSAAGITLVGVVALSSIRYSASLVYFLELVPPDRRATVSGVTEMAAGVSFTLITFAGGYIIKLFGYQQLFLFGALLSILGAGSFWWYFRQFQPAAKPQPV
jgi:MFS family permease